jgi:hypothetical protein
MDKTVLGMAKGVWLGSGAIMSAAADTIDAYLRTILPLLSRG